MVDSWNRYFSSLQKDLSKYDRVLYEMVADKDKLQTNRLGKMRWRPPRRLPGRRGGHGFSIIGTIQRTMASLLTLEFQLECMDYRRENWYHADLDYDTFAVLQVTAYDLVNGPSYLLTLMTKRPKLGLIFYRVVM